MVIARVLLPAGRDPLAERFEVREGGLDATRERVLEIVPGAAALIADPSVPVDAELLETAGDELRVVSNFAVGYDNIDLDACRARGVTVTNTPGVLTEATAELALALTLAAARQLGGAERDLRAGRWRGWDPAAYRGLELRGSTVGVVGLGRIGGRYAELVGAIGAEVVYSGPSAKPEAERALGARRLELAGLLAAADVVSVHAPAAEATRRLIGAAELDLIGPAAVLVNTSRGSLIDSAALAAALREGRLGAAGLDVYEHEPEVPAELLEAPRCVLLPHIGSATRKSRDAMARLAAENAIAVLDGRDPLSPVGTG
ncbi:MAG TPA: NAD(P)-dependent oxidoreductase [Solirubrobacterales bacterium]|nr:NAD(P)-dependent oxidoreductase [Solirubrobacterales bacterium]